jgi:hypothetical protein
MAMAACAICLLTSPGPTHWKPRMRPLARSATILLTRNFPPMKGGLSSPAETTVSMSA